MHLGKVGKRRPRGKGMDNIYRGGFLPGCPCFVSWCEVLNGGLCTITLVACCISDIIDSAALHWPTSQLLQQHYRLMYVPFLTLTILCFLCIVPVYLLFTLHFYLPLLFSSSFVSSGAAAGASLWNHCFSLRLVVMLEDTCSVWTLYIMKQRLMRISTFPLSKICLSYIIPLFFLSSLHHPPCLFLVFF